MSLSTPQAEEGRDPLDAARRWLDEYAQVALATVVSAWGSAPVPVGGQLVVAPGERFEGSVSGGCVEVDVITEAADVIADGRPRLLEFGVTDETAWRAGLPCGGTIRVFLERLERGRDSAFLDRIREARQQRRMLTIVTDIENGTRRVLEEKSAVSLQYASCLASGKSRLVETSGGSEFVQAIVPPIRLVIAGATHTGQVLADLAQRIGYEVIVVDPREAFATQERLGGASTMLEWPEASLSTLRLDWRTAVVALTHAAHIDDEALSTALRSPCLYIGALGSRRTHANRTERLRIKGFSAHDLNRIHAPVGLAIGAEGPAEIAVSILAEIIKVSRARE